MKKFIISMMLIASGSVFSQVSVGVPSQETTDGPSVAELVSDLEATAHLACRLPQEWVTELPMILKEGQPVVSRGKRLTIIHPPCSG